MKYPSYVDEKEIKHCGSSEELCFALTIPFTVGRGKGTLRVILRNPGSTDFGRGEERVCAAAHYAGYDGVTVLYLVPYRADSPAELLSKYRVSPDYAKTAEKNLEVIREYCADGEVAFAWGANTVGADFAEEYDRQIAAVTDTVVRCASGAVSIDGESPEYCLGGEDWWETILTETYEACEEKYLVLHHNMFGASCEAAGLNRREDFEIYCHRQGEVCVPSDCGECEFYAGDEMGFGVACLWLDSEGNMGADERVVQHGEAYAEKERAAQYAECGYYSEPILVCLAMPEEQAERESRSECLEPALPSPKEAYFKLDLIPEELCISKQLGWEKKITAYKRNAEQILHFLCPEGTELSAYMAALDLIEGEEFCIYGFGD